MTRIAALLAVGLTLYAGPALAADPAGQWRGTLIEGRKLDIGIDVRAAPAGYQATYEDITQEFRQIPMKAVGTATSPAFEATSPFGRFLFRWDAPTGSWRGVWRDGSGAYAMPMNRGVIPPAPLITRLDKIALAVIAGLIILEAAGIARLLQLRRRRKLRRTALTLQTSTGRGSS